MIRHRQIDRLCALAMALALVLTGLLFFGEALGIQPASAAPEYASRLFDDSRVHTVDLQVENWGEFLEHAPEEEYIPCTAVIDGEVFYQVGLRAKGNNSLRLTEEYGLARYSLKLEFDHYVDGGNYHGLDKFSLDASFQDNSYLKTYLVYDMMEYMGVPAPLRSFVWVTVNGSPWGLFLTIEEPEEAFARRNFGVDHGQLYKPDYTSLNAENADVALRYVDDDPASYPNIFDNAKFSTDGADREQLLGFAPAILRKLASGGDISVPGNRPYRAWTPSRAVPAVSETCTACGQCAAQCPARAIPPDDPKHTDPERCFLCMRCIARCPQHARTYPAKAQAMVDQRLAPLRTVRRENELFV